MLWSPDSRVPRSRKRVDNIQDIEFEDAIPLFPQGVTVVSPLVALPDAKISDSFGLLKVISPIEPCHALLNKVKNDMDNSASEDKMKIHQQCFLTVLLKFESVPEDRIMFKAMELRDKIPRLGDELSRTIAQQMFEIVAYSKKNPSMPNAKIVQLFKSHTSSKREEVSDGFLRISIQVFKVDQNHI